MRRLCLCIVPLVVSIGVPVFAQDEPKENELTPEQAQKIDLDAEKKESILPETPPEAPPPPPRKKGFVIESGLGALGWIGKFGNVAPPAYFLHAQLGYEIFNWFMLFIDGEMAFTNTGLASDATKNRAVPIFGFGGGLRTTIHFTDRVAMYIQGNVGAMMADVPIHALAVLGFSAAESLGLTVGGRLGFEWYQLNPHIALALSGGPRFAPGWARSIGGDLPLMIDGEASLRYVF